MSRNVDGTTFRLNRAEKDTRDATVARLQVVKENLEDQIVATNDVIRETLETLNSTVQEYNEVLGEASEYASAVVQSARHEIEDHTEKWQDSKTGSAAVDWADTWEAL